MQQSLLSFAQSWPPTRAEALGRLTSFVPRAGRAYAAERNYDRGPAERANVSVLSPYLRTRTISETEVLAAVIERHGEEPAQKYIQEVFWRTYWKGWLETHPVAWSRYRERLAGALDACHGPDAVMYGKAIAGETGIDAFDAWAHELVEQHYLHNHARMWFASIWVFTLGLPWEAGADFFMRNLLDGDPASNTLSWRWVAGLHTRGRTYLATRDNIRRYTDGRFELGEPLKRSAVPLDDAPIPLLNLPELVQASKLASAPALLLLHDDDLQGDGRELPAGIGTVVALTTAPARSPQSVSTDVCDFTAALAREAVTRTAGAVAAVDGGLIEVREPAQIVAQLVAAARAADVSTVLVPYAPVGPTRELLAQVQLGVTSAGLRYAEFARRYDALSWPAATRGYFNLRSRIPAILSELGIGPG